MRKHLFALFGTLIIAAWAYPAAANDASDIDIHGFISQGYLTSSEYNYLAHNSKNGSFEYNEVGINFSKQLSDRLHVGMQFFSRDLGDVSNNKVHLDWAYGDYQFTEWLGLRVGRIKLPMGLYNEIRDMDMLRTSIVLPQGIYNDFERDEVIAINGAGLHGNVNMKAVGGLEYQFNIGVINTDLKNGFDKIAEEDMAGLATVNGDNIDNGTTYNGALRWETPLPGLKLSYTNTYQESVTVPVLVAGVDEEPESKGEVTTEVYSAEYTWDNLVLAGEYMTRKVTGSMTVAGITFPMDKINEGYYLTATYRFNDLFSLGVYYEEYFPDNDDKDGDEQTLADHKAWHKDLALTLRFDIDEYWIIKVEGHSVDGTARVFRVDNDDNDYSENQWYYGAAKVTFNF